MNSNESRLINDLLKDYIPDARPVKNASQRVIVKVILSYHQLKDVVSFAIMYEIIISFLLILRFVPITKAITYPSKDIHFSLRWKCLLRQFMNANSYPLLSSFNLRFSKLFF